MISGILFVFTGTFVVWQFAFIGLISGMLASGKAVKGKIPLYPLWMATVLAIAGVVLL